MKMLAIATVLLSIPGMAAGMAGSAAARPAWVDRIRWSEPPTRYQVVVGELWATQEQALCHALDRAALVSAEFAAQAAPGLKPPATIPTSLVQDCMVRDEHVEQVDWTYGPMYRAYLLLELSPSNRQLLLSNWREGMLLRRMRHLGGGLTFAVVCLGSLLAFLRLDQVSRGYYSGWLLMVATGTVVGSAVILYQVWV